MVVGERKPIAEIMEMVRPYKKILVAGCETCTAECHERRPQAGGRTGRGPGDGLPPGRPGDGDPGDQRRPPVHPRISAGYRRPDRRECRRGSSPSPAAPASRAWRNACRAKPVLPGLNTMFIGETSSTGVWQERCQGCGDCVLGITGGLCPVTRCAKGLLNGPCGGSQGGQCEVSMTLKCDVPCVWAMIYERLSQLGELDRLLTYLRPQGLAARRLHRPPPVGAAERLRFSLKIANQISP